MKMEEWGYVLDYLPTGKPMDRTFEAVAQVVGDRYLTLLEVIIIKGKDVKIDQKIGIGKDNRSEVEKIKRRMQFSELTNNARSALPKALEKIVGERENEFVNFFNRCGPITLRQHQLELIPGIGKKHMEDLLSEREKEPFKSFEEMKARIALLPNPAHMIVDRIMIELEGKDKYYLFVRPPALAGTEGYGGHGGYGGEHGSGHGPGGYSGGYGHGFRGRR